MSKRKGASGIWRNPNTLPVMVLTLAFLVSCIVAIVLLTPKRYDVKLGSVAPENILATRTIEDKETTQALRQAARNGVKPIQKLDEELADEKIRNAAQFFTEVKALRQNAQTLRLQRIEGSGIRADGSIAIHEWKKLITEEEMFSFLETLSVSLPLDQGWWLLYVEDSELLRLQDAVLPKLTTTLSNGLQEAAIPSVRSVFLQELNATSISDMLKSVGERIVDTYLVATYVVDEEATELAREAAEQTVIPALFERGDVVVKKDQLVKASQLELLEELGLVRAKDVDLKLNIGIVVYLLCVYTIFGFYLRLFHPSVFTSKKNMLIIGISVIMVLLLTMAFHSIDPHITLGLLATIWVAILVDKRSAMAVNLLLACSTALIAGGAGSSMLSFDALVMLISTIAGGQAAVYILMRNQKRSLVIGAGIVGGVVAGLVIFAAYMMLNKDMLTILVDVGLGLGSYVVCAMFCVGSLPVWENVFDVATSARLNELSNTNHPLLRQLMTDAPGTYHHSVLVANLAENAAEAIGADSLLCRVGAYYHDVGKLRRPLYFKENQKSNENIHDSLSPLESATIIIAHQKDSVALLNKHKMPSAVVRIAMEHHGNSMAAYFYHKAVSQAQGQSVSQKPFRYPASRPGTKESAIVMLADSCEAAVRSLPDPTREAVEDMVNKVVKGKIDDGQLGICPLTFSELNEIKQSFLRTFGGMLHERIQYPDMQKKSREEVSS